MGCGISKLRSGLKNTNQEFPGVTRDSGESNTAEVQGVTRESGDMNTAEVDGVTRDSGESNTKEVEGVTRDSGDMNTAEVDGITRDSGESNTKEVEGVTRDPGDSNTKEMEGVTRDPGDSNAAEVDGVIRDFGGIYSESERSQEQRDVNGAEMEGVTRDSGDAARENQEQKADSLAEMEDVTRDPRGADIENQTNQEQREDHRDNAVRKATKSAENEAAERKKRANAKKTAEKLATNLKDGLKVVQAKCESLVNAKPRLLELIDAPFTSEFKQSLLILSTYSCLFIEKRDTPHAEILRYQPRVARCLCRGRVLTVVLDALADGLKRWDFFNKGDQAVEEFWYPTLNMMKALLNYSDFVNSIKMSVAEHGDLLPQLVSALQRLREPHMNRTLSDEHEKIVRISLGIIHNTGSLKENVPRLRELNVIPLLLSYVNSPVMKIRVASIATLADLVTHSEVELLVTHTGTLNFILGSLERALEAANHREVGWSVEELLRAVRQLARNDLNKAILVDEKCLPILVKSVQVGKDEELQEALNCLWVLSRDDRNKSIMAKEPGLVREIRDRYQTVTGQAWHSCYDILLSLRDYLDIDKAGKTAEEKLIKMNEDGLKMVRTQCNLLLSVERRDRKQEGEPYTRDFTRIIQALQTSFTYLMSGVASQDTVAKFRLDVAKYLCRRPVLKAIFDALVEGLEKWDFLDVSGQFVKDFWLPTRNMMQILKNYSDVDKSLIDSIVEHKKVVPRLIQALNKLNELKANSEPTENMNEMVEYCLAILHNTVSLDENGPRLLELHLCSAVLPYTNSPETVAGLTSIEILAKVVNETEGQKLCNYPHIFTFILHRLEKAIDGEEESNTNWTINKLLRAVRQLARTDANKSVLVERGCLRILLKCVQDGNDDVRQEALECMWLLSFDKKSKSSMVAEPGLIETVYDSYNTETVYDSYNTKSERVLNSCQGILWSLRELLGRMEKFQSVDEQMKKIESRSVTPKESEPDEGSVTEAESKTSKERPSKGHVMISYQWKHQEDIKKIHSVLTKNGVPVWVDFKNMYGSTCQAMAEAVENSCAVIIAISQKYKDSPNTRAEAEYSFKKKKTIIPLLMQRGYVPDGWLGLILGSKLFYDFSGKYEFDSKMTELLKAVRHVIGGDEVEQPEVPAEPTPAVVEAPEEPKGRTKKPQLNEELIRSWTREDVVQWLAKFDLEHSPLKNLEPEQILFMHSTKYNTRGFFYHCLEKKLTIKSIEDLSRASKAFADLPSLD